MNELSGEAPWIWTRVYRTGLGRCRVEWECRGEKGHHHREWKIMFLVENGGVGPQGWVRGEMCWPERGLSEIALGVVCGKRGRGRDKSGVVEGWLYWELERSG